MESQVMDNKKYYVVLLAFLLVACSKTPKEQAIAGFYNGCNVVNTPEVKKYCDCMSKELDASIPNKLFNNPDADQRALMAAFTETMLELVPKCKK
jgi:hypothetical protein